MAKAARLLPTLLDAFSRFRASSSTSTIPTTAWFLVHWRVSALRPTILRPPIAVHPVLPTPTPFALAPRAPEDPSSASLKAQSDTSAFHPRRLPLTPRPCYLPLRLFNAESLHRFAPVKFPSPASLPSNATLPKNCTGSLAAGLSPITSNFKPSPQASKSSTQTTLLYLSVASSTFIGAAKASNSPARALPSPPSA